jgi:hypothetical protein
MRGEALMGTVSQPPGTEGGIRMTGKGSNDQYPHPIKKLSISGEKSRMAKS